MTDVFNIEAEFPIPGRDDPRWQLPTVEEFQAVAWALDEAARLVDETATRLAWYRDDDAWGAGPPIGTEAVGAFFLFVEKAKRESGSIASDVKACEAALRGLHFTGGNPMHLDALEARAWGNGGS